MNKLPINKIVTALFLSTASVSVFASPAELNRHDLAKVTAGYGQPAPNGGAIIGNGSTAKLVSSGEVSISDGAQTDVKALNLVNSSESTVANGVNVFDGRITEQAELGGVRFDIEQRNTVTQDQRRLASLHEYERGANTETTHAQNSERRQGSSAARSSGILGCRTPITSATRTSRSTGGCTGASARSTAV